MSDEEARREARLAAIGEPGRRRLVELGRLASALEATRAVAAGTWNCTSPSSILALAPVRALLEFRRGDRAGFEVDESRPDFRVTYFVRPEDLDRLSTDVPTTLTLSPTGFCVRRSFPLVLRDGERWPSRLRPRS